MYIQGLNKSFTCGSEFGCQYWRVTARFGARMQNISLFLGVGLQFRDVDFCEGIYVGVVGTHKVFCRALYWA